MVKEKPENNQNDELMLSEEDDPNRNHPSPSTKHFLTLKLLFHRDIICVAERNWSPSVVEERLEKQIPRRPAIVEADVKQHNPPDSSVNYRRNPCEQPLSDDTSWQQYATSSAFTSNLFLFSSSLSVKYKKNVFLSFPRSSVSVKLSFWGQNSF